MIIVALWCIQLKPCDRPLMKQVVEMLEREAEDLTMPPKPSLYPGGEEELDLKLDQTSTSHYDSECAKKIYNFRSIPQSSFDYSLMMAGKTTVNTFGLRLRSGPFVGVKILDTSKSSEQDFFCEIMTIGRIHHINVVRLVGLCRKIITCSIMRKYMRYHWELLEVFVTFMKDENFIPKISDLGLAKLYPRDNSIVSLTDRRGAIGYTSPELSYKNIGGVSYKVDIYSFGILLMEMANKRKNLNLHAENSSSTFFPT
ncbi:hypothetical protein AHAS_Ahas14G0044400 [Arachis hypogaea]